MVPEQAPEPGQDAPPPAAQEAAPALPPPAESAPEPQAPEPPPPAAMTAEAVPQAPPPPLEPPPAEPAAVETPPPPPVAEPAPAPGPPPEAVTGPPPEKAEAPAEPAIDPALAALSDLVSRPRDAAPAPVVPPPLPVPERSARERPPEPVPNRYYTVQVGSFQDPANAASLARELSGKGWDAFVSDWTNGAGKTWKVVRVGRYGTEKEAADASTELRSAANLRGNVIRVR